MKFGKSLGKAVATAAQRATSKDKTSAPQDRSGSRMGRAIAEGVKRAVSRRSSRA